MNGSPAYRTSPASPSQPLPSLAEIGATRSMTLTAPAAALAALCARISEAAAKEFELEVSLLGDLLFGAGVTCAIATVAGIARLLGAPGGVPLLMVCFVLGAIYGVVKARWRRAARRRPRTP